MTTITPAGIPWLARMSDPPKPKPRPVASVPYDIPVRPDFIGRFILPEDFGAADAERVCGIIRAIAFPAEVPGE